MAGYPKIWTTLLHEDWFVDLSLTERGLYFHLILLAKEQGDISQISLRGWTGLGSVCGCDRGTARKISMKFQRLGKITIVEKSKKCVRIEIANYDKYQSLKHYKPRKSVSKESGKSPQQAERKQSVSINRQAEGKVDNVDKGQKSEAQLSPVQSAYFKRFNRDLPGRDYESLLKKYGDEQLLLMMIRHITINSDIKSPVGLLMIARGAPGSHLPDNKYDAWKLELRNVASRKS